MNRLRLVWNCQKHKLQQLCYKNLMMLFHGKSQIKEGFETGKDAFENILLHEFSYRELSKCSNKCKVFISINFKIVECAENIVKFLCCFILRLVRCITSSGHLTSTSPCCTFLPLHNFSKLKHIFNNNIQHLPNHFRKIFSHFLFYVKVNILQIEHEC